MAIQVMFGELFQPERWHIMNEYNVKSCLDKKIIQKKLSDMTYGTPMFEMRQVY
jgi:hypothetical protein